MAEQKGFTGISFPFRFDGRGGVAKSTTSIIDFTHIKESIIQIILTQVGERRMELNFGSQVRNQLFSMTDDETDKSILRFNIQEAIEKYEPRVRVNRIDVFHENSEEREDYWAVEIDFHVIKYMKNDSIRIKLN